MSAFAVAIGTLFEDPNLAVDALWRAGGAGAGIPVRAVRRDPDTVVSYRDGRYVVDTVFLDLRIAEVPGLAQGDTLEVDGAVYTMIGNPVRDRDRLIWTIGAREEPS